MSASRRTRLAGAVALAASVLLIGTMAWAETKPPTTPGGRNAPPPKGVKWEGPTFDAAKARAPAKGTGFRPEIDDEVLLGVKSRKGR